MPGDLCDTHDAVLSEMDHSIATLTEATVATVPRGQMEALVEARPRLSKAFCWTQLVNEAVLRETIVSMGRRTSLERVAHLLCELCFRMRYIGIATENTIVMPFTQIVLADAVGMTPVHVNRLVRKLRTVGALDVGVSALIIADLKLLTQIAGFDDNYLHRQRGPHGAAQRKARRTLGSDG